MEKTHPSYSNPQSGRIMKIHFACTLKSLSSTSCTLFHRSWSRDEPLEYLTLKTSRGYLRKLQLQRTEHLFLKGSRWNSFSPENHKKHEIDRDAWAFGKEDSLILNCLLEIQRPVGMFFEVTRDLLVQEPFCDLKLSCQYQHWQAPFWNSLFNLVMPVGTPYLRTLLIPVPLQGQQGLKSIHTDTWQQPQTSPTAI